MILTKKLSTKQFIISHLLILLISLIFLGGLYYNLNIQNQTSSNRFLAGPVTTLPRVIKLDLDEPEDNILTFDDQILISGKTSPLTEVLISTETNDLVIKSKIDGSFSTTLDLDEGVNTITAVVFDAKGEQKSISRMVFFSKEKI